MLTLVSSTTEKQAAQLLFEDSLRRALKSQGKRRVGFRVGPGEKNPDMEIFSNGQGKLWCTFAQLTDTKVPRYWNAFGFFDPSRTAQEISVELNIPIDTDDQMIAGFFAKDLETDFIYLLHSGRVGGGRPGIGKSAFLFWSRQIPIPVVGVDGQERYGIILGQLGEPSIVGRIEAYARQVAEFKRLVVDGDLQTITFRRNVEAFDAENDRAERFNREFSGRKKGHRSRIRDYVSHHGDIVNSLRDSLTARARTDEKVFNTLLIDLYVSRDRNVVEIYEVKTGVGRQAIYTAIGQLIVHSGGDEQIRKIIVLPADERLPHRVLEALAASRIDLLRFTLNDDGSFEFMAQ